MDNAARAERQQLCRPGRECLRCRYRDCQNQNARRTPEETAMLDCAELKSIWAARGKWIARVRRNKNV